MTHSGRPSERVFSEKIVRVAHLLDRSGLLYITTRPDKAGMELSGGPGPRPMWMTNGLGGRRTGPARDFFIQGTPFFLYDKFTIHSGPTNHSIKATEGVWVSRKKLGGAD